MDTPVPLDADAPDNLELWAPEIRDRIFDFELITRIGFTRKNGSVTVWSLEGSPGNSPAYHELVSLTRPTKNIFKEQLNYVEGYAALRPERAAEIHAQLGVPNAFYGSVAYLQRSPWTTELLYAALRLALFVEQRCKHALACRRPIEYSPQVQPIIPTPRHGTLPSGHATEAFIFAYVLGKLLRDAGEAAKTRTKAAQASGTANGTSKPGNVVYKDPLWAEQLMRFAARCAINRQVAGVHFPVDSAAGMVLGLALGHYFVGRCGAGNGWRGWAFHGEKYPKNLDYEWEDYFDPDKFVRTAAGPHALPHDAKAIEAKNSAILKWLWDKAKEEWM